MHGPSPWKFTPCPEASIQSHEAAEHAHHIDNICRRRLCSCHQKDFSWSLPNSCPSCPAAQGLHSWDDHLFWLLIVLRRPLLSCSMQLEAMVVRTGARPGTVLAPFKGQFPVSSPAMRPFSCPSLQVHLATVERHPTIRARAGAPTSPDEQSDYIWLESTTQPGCKFPILRTVRSHHFESSSYEYLPFCQLVVRDSHSVTLCCTCSPDAAGTGVTGHVRCSLQSSASS